jgi:hypothetical protein
MADLEKCDETAHDRDHHERAEDRREPCANPRVGALRAPPRRGVDRCEERPIRAAPRSGRGLTRRAPRSHRRHRVRRGR